MKRMKQGKRNKKEETNIGVSEKDTTVSMDMTAEILDEGQVRDKMLPVS